MTSAAARARAPHATDALADADADLVARVRGGDRDAYGPLVRRYQQPLYRQLRGMGLDHDTALDIVQDAFVKAYTRLADCRDAASFRAWLFRIARNLALDHLKNVRRLSIPLSELPDADDIADTRPGPAAIGTPLRAALEQLPAPMREAFLLKHDAGYTYDEIASMTDTSASAAKMRVHRAREALRVFLLEHGTYAH